MNTVRRLRSAALVILLAAFLAAIPAHAVLNVSISSSGDFEITPGLPVVDQEIAMITFNADVAYTVTLLDSNNGNLVNGSHQIPYTVRYHNGTEITLSGTPIAVDAGQSATDVTRSLTIFINGNASVGVPAGQYSDTITVEIVGE